MYEFLKALFETGADGKTAAMTFEQLSNKLAENKNIKLVNFGDGGYVSKEKFDAKDTELAGIREQLTTANATIQSYKEMDIEGIKKSASDWEKKYNDDTSALNQKLAEQERAHNEDMFLGSYKFSSKAAADGIRAEFIRRKLPYENGSFLGGKELMDTFMADDDYKAAFVIDTPVEEPQQQPPKPPMFSDPNPQPQQPPKPKMSLVDLMKKRNENPSAPINFE